MFKGHPKGLYVAFFANMGERFGFYTMMAILVLFLQAKYGLSAEKAGSIYSTFYFAIYGLALLGGILADVTGKLMRTILSGLIIMFLGYVLMSVPGFGLGVTLAAPAIIALGNGLFKGNLQALVGNLYEDPKYAHLRDRAFTIFYMGINIGAFFAPSAATGVRNWWLKTHGLGYNANLPQLAHGYLNGEQVDLAALQSLANQVSSAPVTNLKEFAAHYIEVFGQGYHIAFGVAGISMVISLIIYLVLNKYLRYGDIANKKKEELPPTMQEISPKETRERLTALGLVFITVIFFWMAFHQNGLTLTLFARDYIREHVSRWSYIFFDLRSFLPLIFAIIGLIYALNKNVTGKMRFGGLSLAVASLIVLYFVVRGFNDQMPIEPEKFQHFNPIFIVFLTPVVVWFFGWLDQKGKEPSTPAR
jgi:POT family proton-dependent oligopeptide transporter